MIFNTPGDFSEVMLHKDDYYSNGTEVMLTDKFINTHMFNGKKIWKYAKFNNKVTRNGQLAYFFYAAKISWYDFNEMGIDYSELDNYAPYFVIYAFDIENAIQEFTRPYKLSDDQKNALYDATIYNMEHPKRDWDYPEMIIAWIVYIATMIGSLIFVQYYLLHPIITYIFLKYRKGVMER